MMDEEVHKPISVFQASFIELSIRLKSQFPFLNLLVMEVVIQRTVWVTGGR